MFVESVETCYQRSVGDESRGALEMRAGEKCCRKCWGGVLEKVL